MQKLFKKKWIKATSIVLSLIILLCAAGAIWNAVVTNAEMDNYPPGLDY